MASKINSPISRQIITIAPLDDRPVAPLGSFWCHGELARMPLTKGSKVHYRHAALGVARRGSDSHHVDTYGCFMSSSI
jgi:hypothetical protein